MQVSVEHVEPSMAAFVDMQGPYSQVPNALQQLYTQVAARGLVPEGMPRAIYVTDPASAPESQARWKVQTNVAGDPDPSPADESGFGVALQPEADEACAVHRGPYDTVPKTYTELIDWIGANGYSINGPPAEVYLNNPAETSPEEYLTEVRFPVRRA